MVAFESKTNADFNEKHDANFTYWETAACTSIRTKTSAFKAFQVCDDGGGGIGSGYAQLTENEQREVHI